MKKLKVGVIGLGRAGMMHLRNMMNIPRIEILAVSELFLENVKEEVTELGIPKMFSDYNDLLAIKEIEAVFIFSSTDTHEEITIAAARAGKNIFCEKPLSMSLEEEKSLAVVQEVEKNNVKLAIGFNRRVDDQFLEMHQKIQAGIIGEPQVVKITSRDPGLLPHDLILRIGGLVFDFTMHDFDMVRYMMGSNIVEVYAKGTTLIDPTLKEIDDVDTLAVMLEFENGSYGLIDNSRKAVYGYDQRVEVFGSKGMIKAENVSGSTIETYLETETLLKNPQPNFMERYRNTYIREINLFVDALLDDQPLVATGMDVIMAQRVAAAVIESMKSGVPVKVDAVYPEVK
ncbi:inositol 2-dehydrogenase [Enterococcus faecium]|uniref:inositol 2-dehydrogenase n=1 Tax=Enterococcus faecium TaxID=1352 RepID=UPI00338F5C90